MTNQKVKVTNSGDAKANTGGNTATGNDSVNTATNDQDTSSGGNANVQSNTGSASNSSNGSANITTGSATATGNQSWTQISQGDPPAGLAFVDQTVIVINDGDSSANTGRNTATGNGSENTATNDQEIPGAGTPGTILSNTGRTVNESNGSAGVTTGDATSTGSQSHDSVAQWATMTAPSGSLGGIFDVSQSARIDNSGDATANTGRNTAIGNQSDNVASNDQDANAARGPPQRARVVLSNVSTTSNSSNGAATIKTGNANAVGVSSTTQITQASDGVNVGLHFVDQRANVINDGTGVANSGRNTAIGNQSINDASNDQTAAITESGAGGLTFRGNVVLSNISTASNNSGGSASITTGDAMATGVDASHTTTIDQSANGSGQSSGFAFVDQRANVINDGDATGTSGGNLAIGNDSLNLVDNSQDATITESGAGNLNLRDVVLNNISSATNNSNGAASIKTGAAHGIGIMATNSVTQSSNVAFGDSGFAFVDQRANISNEGEATGDSGRNTAVGNTSFNVATNDQDNAIAESGAGSLNARDIVGSNIASTSNTSNGSASIETGTACACNTASNAVSQDANFALGASGFAFFDQRANVNNDGDSTANSGRNTAVGNDSFNSADNSQDPTITESGAGSLRLRDYVGSNISNASNNSNGIASIKTGSAQGTGITSTTTIGQGANFANGASGFAIFDQRARVNNDGDGTANTGRNTAVGNDSFNDTFNDQTALVSESGAGSLNGRDVVVSNMSDAKNQSDGSASIATGDATAYGTYGSSDVAQWASFTPAVSGFALLDQRSTVLNEGEGVANSGRNTAIGNTSFNTNGNDQDNVISESGAGRLNLRDVVQSNIASTNNTSNGGAVITTGNATAYGNATNTKIGVAADLALTTMGFAIVDQRSRVVNDGDAFANTGGNLAVGNDSLNLGDNSQDATITESGAGALNARNVVLSNIAGTSNVSNGSANLTTGNAYALGNYSATNMQLAAATGASPLTLADQNLSIINDGTGDANSGQNTLTGNFSINDNANDQETPITQSGAGSLNIASKVSSNIATTENRSDGSSSARTGNAVAIGNISVQSACSGLNTAVDCPEVSLPPLPPPSCPCKKAVTPPPVTPPTTTPPVVTPGPVGQQLPVTGGPLGVQAALGLMLVALGSLLRRRSRTAG
jgi:hypothetical protein